MVNARSPRQMDLLAVTVADIALWCGISRFAARRYLIRLGLLPPNSGGTKARILMQTIRDKQPEFYRAIKSRATSASLRDEFSALEHDLLGV